MNVYEATVREFILSDGNHNKFWRYWIFEKEGYWYAHWGKIGSPGQAKGFSSTIPYIDARAKGHEKINKSYQGGPVVEVDVRTIFAITDITALVLDNAWLRRAKRDTATPTTENEDVELAVKDLLRLDKMLEGLS